MQDIAGVRAVVPDLEDLRTLQRHIESRWHADTPGTKGVVDPTETDDYIKQPRDSGYRAVHLVVEYNGCLVEVQLRTGNQHFWAELSERVSRQIDIELKAGGGPPEIVDFFVEMGGHVGALDEGDESAWSQRIDLRPWGGEQLQVFYNPDDDPDRTDR